MYVYDCLYITAGTVKCHTLVTKSEDLLIAGKLITNKTQ